MLNKPVLFDDCIEEFTGYMFLSGQRNFNGIIDMTAIISYMNEFEITDRKEFIQLIYGIDNALRSEENAKSKVSN